MAQLRFLFHRTSACDRPRTYDKFYQKTPGNFHSSAPGGSHETDSAISVCSSEEDRLLHKRGDRGPPLEAPGTAPSQRKVKKTKKKRGELQYSRTITERDVKHLERHLSMKKTLRKKMMRDLQQAFVDDPSKFTREDKARDSKGCDDIITAFDFDPQSTKRTRNENRFLEILRAGSSGSEDSGHGSPPPVGGEGGGGAGGNSGDGRQHKFRSVRERPKPKYPLLSDSSSCGGDDTSEHNQAVEEIVVVATEELKRLDASGGGEAGARSRQSHDVSRSGIDEGDGPADGDKGGKKKKSFWQMLLGGGNKKSNKDKS